MPVALPSSLLLPLLSLLLLLFGFSSSHRALLASLLVPSWQDHSCRQLPVASSQLTHARTHSHFHFVFVASAPSAAAAPPAAVPCCLPAPLSFWRSRKRKSCGRRRRCFCSGFMTFFLSANALSSHTYTHSHTHAAGSASQPPRSDTFPLRATRPLLCLYLMPVAAVVVVVAIHVAVVTVTAASAFAIFSLSFGSAVAFAFSFRSCLNATSCADCAAAAAAAAASASASALPRSRSRSRYRSLSRSRRQPLTSVKLNSKYYFLDTLLSGRRRVKQTSCSIHQPAIDIGTHRAHRERAPAAEADAAWPE